MRVGDALLKKVAKILSASAFDVAGGLREDEFNNFLTAHYYGQQSPDGKPGGIYAGGGSLDDLGLKYSWTVDAPIVTTIAPLSAAKFKPLVEGWIASVPELNSFGVPPTKLPKYASGILSDPPPPNIQLKAPKMTLRMAYDPAKPPAVLSFSMTATGFVSVTTSGNEVTVRIVPIAVRLDNPGAFRKAVAATMKKLGFREKAGGDPDCIALEQLIRHVVNAVVAPRLSSFVKEFGFPVPIKLFNNVAILSVDLAVVDKLIVVMAKVGILSTADFTLALSRTSRADEIEASKDRLLSQAEAEFALGAGNQEKRAKIKQLKTASTYPNRGLFLLLHERFFQVLANALLVVSASHEDGGSAGPIFYRYGWSMRTWDPHANIVGNNLEVSVNVEGKAWAQAGIHTHCGDVTAGLSATADALPAKTTTVFYFDNHNRELWMSMAAKPFDIIWSIGGLPWPLSDIVATLLGIFSNLGVLFIAALGLRWKNKLTTLPDHFPGTQLKYDLALDKQVVADPATGALMVAGSVNFKS